MKFVFIIFILFAVVVSGYSSECDNDSSICSFYCKKSQELGCPKTNYLTSFGHRYCQLFINKEKSYTESAKVVLSNIRNCLVERLAQNSNLTCENVDNIAYSSHIDCYVANNFCELGTSDRMVTLWYIRGEFFDPLFISTMRKIVIRCDQRHKITQSNSRL